MTDTAKQELLRALESIGAPYEFMVTGSRPLVLPGLNVDGVGEIGLPVSPADARALISAADRAPFGRGEETVLDPAVRATWQIEPARIRFVNPAWQAFTAWLVEAVREGFAIDRPIQHRLHKLLVYEAEGHFGPHKDSEKEDGMFATLVVYLPSRHEGGRLVVRHGGAAKAVDLDGEQGAFELQFVAFYADCEHEVEPVTAGYRVALVYNLLLGGQGEPLAAPDYSAQCAAVATALARLFEEEGFSRIAVAMEHEYSKEGLHPDRLKGADRARFGVLAEVARDHGLDCHLALLVHSQLGEADYDTLPDDRYGSYWDDSTDFVEIAEIYEEEYALEGWLGADGEPLDLDRMKVDPDEIVRDSDVDLPYEQEVSGPTGNEGISVERWYRAAVAVLWPRERFVELLAAEGPSVAVPALREMMRADDPPSADTLTRFAFAIVSHWSRGMRVYGSAHEQTAEMLGCLADLRNAEVAAAFLRTALTEGVSASIAPRLVTLCEALEWTPCREPLVDVVAAQSEETRFVNLPELVKIVTALCLARVPMSEPRRTTCAAVLMEVLRLIPHLDGRDAHDWRNRVVLDRHGILAPLVLAAAAVGTMAELGPLVSCALADPLLYNLREVLVPAAVAIRALPDPAVRADPALRRLHDHCVAELRSATTAAPEEPTDWRQEVNLGHSCQDCIALALFARDPDENVHRFSVGQPRRRHLREQIDHHGLDMSYVTERAGRPYTLVCRKTRDSYERAVRQYEGDLRSLKAMEA